MSSLLIVVDYQNDFVIGEFGFENAVKIEKPLVNKIRQHRQAGSKIIFTMDANNDSCIGIKHNKYDDNDFGYQLYGLVNSEKSPDDIFFKKDRYGSCDLFDFLRKYTFDKIEIAGIVTNVCVLVNTILALTAIPSANIIIDCSCTASNNLKLCKYALELLKELHVNIKNYYF